jgi:2'-5' RNA ligase
VADRGDLSADSAPFVLTAELDSDSFGRFNDLRRRFYAPERNQVPAHVTLFHHLPRAHSREIRALLKQVAANQPAIELTVAEVKTIGTGVAVFLRSPRLNALRDSLAAEWRPWLTGQDQAGFRPHVTIQNKVGEAEARATQREVAATLSISRLRCVGLHLWRYRNGPWEDAQLFRFR